MRENTKSLIKHTILGLLAGGGATALYMNSVNKKKPVDQEFSENEIVVPLSKRHFMKSVRKPAPNKAPGKDKETSKKEEAVKDISNLSPRDMAALKKSILNKKASLKMTGPESREMSIHNISGTNTPVARDDKGRFCSTNKTQKSAGSISDGLGVVQDKLGFLGGIFLGASAMKLIGERVLINRKQQEVEQARRKYTELINKEVNDVDVPYYRKTAADRGVIGSSLGFLALTGVLTGTATGMLIYKIMERRRKEAEKERDKDLKKYPRDKAITFKFTDAPNSSTDFFQ